MSKATKKVEEKVAPTVTIWDLARTLREDLKRLSLDARDYGEHELAEGLGRAYRELIHGSVDSYDPQNRTV